MNSLPPSASHRKPDDRTRRIARRRIRQATCSLAAAFALAALACTPSVPRADGAPAAHAAHASRDTLWHLVHDACAPAARRGVYPPAPCAEVAAAPGSDDNYAVLKDRTGRYQYLVLPLARVTGIESPALLAPDAPNYFADAWNTRLYVEAALHRDLPRDALVMVVNSTVSRSQDQLHIHVDCIRPDVRDALRRLLPMLTPQWRPLDRPLPPHGHMYWARWASGDALAVDPFRSLAAALPRGDRMGLHSLAVAGALSADGRSGFVLLSGRVGTSKDDRASADELQDFDCAIAGTPPL